MEEQPEIKQETNETIDPTFEKTLTHIVLNDIDIQKDLRKSGYTQFQPPYTGFTFDTIPPYLTPQQYEQWEVEQERRRARYLEDMPMEKKERIAKEQKGYDRTVEYTQLQVRNSLELLQNSRYGLKDVFKNRLKGEEVDSRNMISSMKEHGIEVKEFPEWESGFDGKSNHGEARYTNGKWSAKFNMIALEDPKEVLHEYVAIEAFDQFLRERPSFGNAIKALPLSLVVLMIGKSGRESFARGQYVSQKMLTIPIIEEFYSVISSYKDTSPTVQNLKRYLGA